MKQFINKVFSKITLSVTTGNNHSSVRIQSYIVLLPILFMTLIFVIIEVWSFIHSISCGSTYHISNEIIAVFAMLLSHHLAIVFSRKKSQGIDELKGSSNIIDEPQ